MQKRLYLSRRDRVISGVCGGIADYFNVDPTLVRIIWILLTITSGGLGIVAYLAAMVVVPNEPRLPRQDRHDAATAPTDDAAPAAGDASPSGDVGTPAAGNSADAADAQHNGRTLVGLALVAVGAYFLIHNLMPHFFYLQGRFVGPALLIIVGILVLTRGLGRRG